MSHLVGSTHALLSTPSASALFDEDVILQSLTQLRDDSQLSLLKNLSSLKGGKQLASTASSSGPRRGDASLSSSSYHSRSFSKGSRDSERLSSSRLVIGRRLPLKATSGGVPISKIVLFWAVGR